MNLCVLFGGMSSESDISLLSAYNILNNLDKNKYNLYPVYISKEGLFYKVDSYNAPFTKSIIREFLKIDNIFLYLQQMDVVFPVLHGKFGEDGSIQGMLELLQIPYVGCNMLSSAICMDKDITKRILEKSHIEVAKYKYIKKFNEKYLYIDDDNNRSLLDMKELIQNIELDFGYPVFIKASKSGSSIGVYKSSRDTLENDILNAFKYDDKVLVEECINGRELECAVLGNNELLASPLGEIIKEDFYSFDAKYHNDKDNTRIVTDLPEEIVSKIQSLAKHAFFACECHGLARVDFFLEESGRIILNEINTMPGFTKISMYPKLMQEVGLNYSKLLDKLIELAIQK